jgi:hypothetical protein
MSLYEIGRCYATPVRMMVVDVSPCGRFVTMAAKDRSGLVMERVFVRSGPDVLLKPFRPTA